MKKINVDDFVYTDDCERFNNSVVKVTAAVAKNKRENERGLELEVGPEDVAELL